MKNESQVLKSHVYMDAVTAAASARANGDTLSIETQSGAQDSDMFSYVHANFPQFVAGIRFLHPAAHDILLEYYLCNKTQAAIGRLHGQTQTAISSLLRLSVRAFCCRLMFGGAPTEKTMRDIFTAAGIEGIYLIKKIPGRDITEEFPNALSHVLAIFDRTLSFQETASLLGTKSPTIRKILTNSCRAMLDMPGRELKALGSYFMARAWQVYEPGSRRAARAAKKNSPEVCVRDPKILGEFVRPLSARGMSDVFFSQADS